MLNLDIPITAAIMPFMPHSKSDAQAAYDAGVEVIMHIPMEPLHGNPSWLGSRAIKCNMSEHYIKSIIYDGLSELKYVVGMNNHMGSKVTQDKETMRPILEIAKEQT